MTKTETLLKAFEAGEKLTSEQITAKFGLKNPNASIHTLRSNGYSIYFNKRVKMASYFQMGKPTRALVAAGYKALSSKH